MEQLFLIEVFVDSVSLYIPKSNESKAKSIKIKLLMNFGPGMEFSYKESELYPSKADDKFVFRDIDTLTWTRPFKVGKTIVFPSYPATIINLLTKNPALIDIWNDDTDDKKELLATGRVIWHTDFFHMLRKIESNCTDVPPIALKLNAPLSDECCCREVGYISLILRLQALGPCLVSTFLRNVQDTEAFNFTTNKNTSVFQCKKFDSPNPNFKKTSESSVLNKTEESKWPIEKIRMGDIRGPCGNKNCGLTNRMKSFIRHSPAYRQQLSNIRVPEGTENKKKLYCGHCVCHD